MATNFDPRIQPFSYNSGINNTNNGNSNYWSNTTAPNQSSDSVEGYQFPNLTGTVQNQRNASQGMLGNQDTMTNKFLGNYANAIGNQETTNAMWNRLANETGFNRYNQQALDINNQLAAIPQTYTAATRGFDVNANQLGRIMNMQTEKLSPIAQRATAQAQNAGNLMTNQMNLGQQQQQKELLPYQAQQSFLTDRIARETSMFTQDNQNELQALTNKMNAGITLTNAERERVNQLKIAEEGYKNNMAIAQAQIAGNTNIAKINSGTTLGANQTYFNPYSGYAYNPTNPNILNP